MAVRLAVLALAGATVGTTTAVQAAGPSQRDIGRRHIDPAAERALPNSADGRMRPSYPQRVGFPATTRKALTITSPRWSSPYATVRAWQRDESGRWALAYGPVRARLGASGWAPARRRRQGTNTSPAGVFSVPYAFGRAPNPGTRLPYRQFDAHTWWPYEPRDPATYNVWQPQRPSTAKWRPDWAEHLIEYPHQYLSAAVIGFNLPRGIHYSTRRHVWVAEHQSDVHRGGGIFLHVNGDSFTAGCISLPAPKLRHVLRWLSPGAQPRIAMGPRRFLVR